MSAKRFAACVAMARYVSYAVLITFSEWLRQAGEQKWDQMTSYETASLLTSLGLSALVAIGAIMNGSWHEARTTDKIK